LMGRHRFDLRMPISRLVLKFHSRQPIPRSGQRLVWKVKSQNCKTLLRTKLNKTADGGARFKPLSPSASFASQADLSRRCRRRSSPFEKFKYLVAAVWTFERALIPPWLVRRNPREPHQRMAIWTMWPLNRRWI